MKLNKLVIAMGLATALIGCADDLPSDPVVDPVPGPVACADTNTCPPVPCADTNTCPDPDPVPCEETDTCTVVDPQNLVTYTVIDDYIALGDLDIHCDDETNTDTFSGITGRPDVSGEEAGKDVIDTKGFDTDDCDAEIKGNVNTFDTAKPNVQWLHEMKGLKGGTVINPFTDMAAVISKVPGNENLSPDELKGKVLEALGYDSSSAYAAMLFEDYGVAVDGVEADVIAELGYLAQSVFAATVELKAKLKAQLGDDYTDEKLAALYTAVLPKLVALVEVKIKQIKEAGGKVDEQVSIIILDLPDVIEFNENGTVSQETLDAVKVEVGNDAKPGKTPVATGTGTGTGTGSGVGGVNQN